MSAASMKFNELNMCFWRDVRTMKLIKYNSALFIKNLIDYEKKSWLSFYLVIIEHKNIFLALMNLFTKKNIEICKTVDYIEFLGD